MKSIIKSFSLVTTIVISSCISCKNDTYTDNCNSNIEFDQSRGKADQTLNYNPYVSENIDNNNNTLTITSNSIPNHNVGLFGKLFGALNPNAIKPQSETYTISLSPKETGTLISLLGENGPNYKFGILFNGLELDPIAAEPFPHKDRRSQNSNWTWNLEALNANLGLDECNAHVQPTGKYHYHGKPTLYLENLNINPKQMTQIGYAADGFPIYYKYAYKDPAGINSEIIAMTSSYQLKSGNRPGDGETAPCGKYNGIYSADYEYIEGLGTLDKANGRNGITPQYPEGTYYYVLTDEFPSIPRYFKGSPSNDFKLLR